jgi:hypothetical protein
VLLCATCRNSINKANPENEKSGGNSGFFGGGFDDFLN